MSESKNDMLRKALILAAKKEAEEFMKNPAQAHEKPSSEMQSKLHAIFKSKTVGKELSLQQGFVNGFKKAAAIILILQIIVLLLVANVEALRNKVFEMIVSANEQTKEITLNRIDEGSTQQEQTFLLKALNPELWPEDMKLVEYINFAGAVSYRFEDETSKNQLDLLYMGENSTASIDNENLQANEVLTLNGHEVSYTFKNGIHQMYWYENDRVINVSTNTTKDILVEFVQILK